MMFGTEKLEWFGYPIVEKIEDIFTRNLVWTKSANVTLKTSLSLSYD